jgi:hypothetical protein
MVKQFHSSFGQLFPADPDDTNVRSKGFERAREGRGMMIAGCLSC